MERTLVFVKPEGLETGRAFEILSRFERKGFKIVKVELMTKDRMHYEKHYEEHKEKPFFEGLVSRMADKPVVACVIEGRNVIELVRNVMGSTNPLQAQPGTIRGDYGDGDIERNFCHGSDSKNSANRELKLWFPNLDSC